jgi:hypothetical protein
MNLTNKQVLGIVAAILSGLVAGTAQLTDVFGPQMAKAIVSLASLGSMMLNSIIVGISGQSSIVRDVRAMPGVENIEINKQANPTLANLAVDPTEEKIVAKAGDERAIQATANT